MTSIAIRLEILFNSVEIELARRWAFHNVPAVFVDRPALHLQKVVKAWWQLYHESICAAQARNRTLWERKASYPAVALDTPALVESLRQIRQLMSLDALSVFRPLSQAEQAAIGLLTLITAYYAQYETHPPPTWKQIL